MPFKKGQSGNPKGKDKGTVSEKAKLWNQLKDFMCNDGAEKFKEELSAMNGKDYVINYLNSLEFFKPKLARTEVDHTTGGQSLPAPTINILPKTE